MHARARHPSAPQVGKHANYTRLYALCRHAYHCDDILPHLEQLTPADIAPFIEQVRCAALLVRERLGSLPRARVAAVRSIGGICPAPLQEVLSAAAGQTASLAVTCNTLPRTALGPYCL